MGKVTYTAWRYGALTQHEADDVRDALGMLEYGADYGEHFQGSVYVDGVEVLRFCGPDITGALDYWWAELVPGAWPDNADEDWTKVRRYGEHNIK